MKNKKLLFVMVMSIIAAAIASGHWVSGRMLGYLEKKDAAIAKLEAELVHINQEKQANREFITRWESINAFKQESIGERRTRFTSFLQNLGSSLGFTFEFLGAPSEQAMKDADRYTILSYNAIFSSDIKNLSEFLAQLDNSERLLRIEKLDIRKRRGLVYSLEPDLTIDITISTPAFNVERQIVNAEMLK